MNHSSSFFLFSIIIFFLLTITGCISGKGGKDYSRSQTRGEASVRIGTIIDINQTEIDGTRTGIGAAAGTVIGAIASKGDRTNWKGDLAATIGGLLGGIIGQSAEQFTTKKKGIELIIDLGDDKLVSVVQEDDGTAFKKGDRVRLTNSSGDTRVVPMN